MSILPGSANYKRYQIEETCSYIPTYKKTLIILLYSLTTFFGLFTLFVVDKESKENFKKWVLDKVNNNYTLYVIVLSTLLVIYGVVFAWFVGCLFLIILLVLLVIGTKLRIKELIHEIYKLPEPENTNNIEIDVAEEV